MATAMAGPVAAFAQPPACTRKVMPSCSPNVERMVPTSSEANSPWAMAPNASMP